MIKSTKKLIKERKKKIKESDQVNAIIEKFRKLPVHSSENFKNWAINWAIYNGKHHFNTKARIEETTDSPYTKGIKHKSKINIITANTDISVAKIMKEQPQPRALPAGSDKRDEKIANVGTIILANAFGQSDVDLTQKTYEALTVAKVMDTAWWKVIWDPKADAGKGYFNVQTYDNFQIFPDPSATCYFDMQYCFHSYMKDREMVEDMYPDLAPLEEYAQEPETKYTYLSKKLDKGVEGKVLVTELWERATKTRPQGRKVIIINDKHIASDVSNPYHKYGKYSLPFIPFHWKKAHDDIYGINTFNDEVNIQREVNALSSLIMENARKMASIKWLVPKGSGIKDSDLDTSAGAIIEYNASQGNAIQGSPAALPSYVSQHMSFLIGSAQDIAGIHEVSMGQLPERGSQMSGTALKLLMDSEQIRHSPAMRRLKSSLKIASFIILNLAKDKISEERMLGITGLSKEYEVEKFSDADLAGSFDVQVQIGSAFSSSPAAKVETLFNVWDRGLPTAAAQGDKGAQEILESLKYGNTDTQRVTELHKNRAHKILDSIVEKGKVMPVSDADDHEIHINIFNEYRLTQEFDEQNEAVKQAIVARIDAHKKLL
ncbi:MAG: hypothetical protein KAS32_26355, partial [Candidatus Peribacteraceae bacterium]|nr:hypothetical protein [Candidatus Peribacteraceae bacterium]